MEGQRNISIVYDSEWYNVNRSRPFGVSFYPLTRLASKHDRGSNPKVHEKCEKDTIVFQEENCITKMLDSFSKKVGGEKSW